MRTEPCEPEPKRTETLQTEPWVSCVVFFYGSTHLKTTHRLNYNIMERSRWIHRTCLDRWYLHAMGDISDSDEYPELDHSDIDEETMVAHATAVRQVPHATAPL